MRFVIIAKTYFWFGSRRYTYDTSTFTQIPRQHHQHHNTTTTTTTPLHRQHHQHHYTNHFVATPVGAHVHTYTNAHPNIQTHHHTLLGYMAMAIYQNRTTTVVGLGFATLCKSAFTMCETARQPAVNGSCQTAQACDTFEVVGRCWRYERMCGAGESATDRICD